MDKAPQSIIYSSFDLRSFPRAGMVLTCKSFLYPRTGLELENVESTREPWFAQTVNGAS